MPQKVIIFDATLFVNAYETQLFRTGLYRVSEQLLKQLLQSDKYDIWLYDTMGRDRIMRQQIMPQYPQTQLLDTDSRAYQFLTDKPLMYADRLRKKQMATTNKVAKTWYKFGKNILRMYAKIIHRLCPQVTLSLPTDAHYLATYYPIPNRVHTYGLQATLIVHDLIPIRHPEWFASEANKHTITTIMNSAFPSDRVVCVSESTRRDFLAFRCDFPQEHTYVAHLAAADVFVPTPLSEVLRTRWGISGRYLLSVCTIEPRKNLETVISAYTMLLQAQTDVPQLVLTGAVGWKNTALLHQIEDIQKQYPGKIILTGYAADTELAQLYSNASVFVYPSLYEGFGLPPLEAMQCGCPVITSNVSSLPEVVGSAGITIEPTNANALAEAIQQLLNGNCEQQKQQALFRARDFSWQRMANIVEQTID